MKRQSLVCLLSCVQLICSSSCTPSSVLPIFGVGSDEILPDKEQPILVEKMCGEI